MNKAHSPDISGVDLVTHRHSAVMPDGHIVTWDVTGGVGEGYPDTILVAGYTENIEAYEPIVRGLAQDRRRIFNIVNKHGIPSCKSTQEIRRAQWRKADALSIGMQHAHAQGLGIGHSEGAIALAGAASEYPHAFDRIILYAPAGLMRRMLPGLFVSSFGEKKRWKAVKESLHKAGKFDVLERWKAADRFANQYLLSAPYLSLREAIDATHAKIGDLLKVLQFDHDIDIHLIAGEHDALLPIADHIPEVSATSGIPEKKFHIIKGGTHVPHVHDPETFLATIRSIIDSSGTDKSV